MQIEDAVKKLHKELESNNIAAIGVGNKKIIIYTLKKSRKGEFPEEYCGFPVEVIRSGPFQPGNI